MCQARDSDNVTLFLSLFPLPVPRFHVHTLSQIVNLNIFFQLEKLFVCVRRESLQSTGHLFASNPFLGAWHPSILL